MSFTQLFSPLSGQRGVGGEAFLLILIILFSSCAPRAYKNLRVVEENATCIEKFRPGFERVLYQTTVGVTGNHLSGILLLRQMPDSSMRLVFTNEAGFKFFDFEFSEKGEFRVHFIIEKMNKDAVKKTLKKDFQLVLMNKPHRFFQSVRFKNQKEDEQYYAYNEGGDFYYYITNANCSELIRMERGSKTKKVLEAFTSELKNGIPDSIRIHHNNFNFDINLKRIYENAEQ